MNLIETLKGLLGERENYHDENLTEEEKAKKAVVLKEYNRVRDLNEKVGTLLLETRPFLWRIDGWQGHYKNGAYWPIKDKTDVTIEIGESRWGGNWLRDRMKDLVGWRSQLSAEQCEAILGGDVKEPIVLGSAYDLECPYCGTKPKFAFDGTAFILIADPCPRPEGIPTTTFELNVPSGKIVMDDDLRQWFPTDAEFDINKTLGIHLQILDYAKAGFACGFVGNSCPAVFKTGDKFTVGNWLDEIHKPGSDPDDYDYIENPDECPWGEKVGSICTDLWWYSIADYDDFKRRFAHYTPDGNFEEWFKHWTHHVADVKPGVYRFTHYTEVDRDAGTVVYCEFEWVREPDPVKDLMGEDAAKDYTAVECLIQNCLDWPTLYFPQSGDDYDDRKSWEQLTLPQKVAALARAADQNMCTISSGTKWHENGFPRTSLSEEATRYAREFAEETGYEFGVVPPLTDVSWMAAPREELDEEWRDFLDDREKDWHWYPISAGYGGFCLGAGVGSNYFRLKKGYHLPLNRSHVLLALNIAQNMIRFPEKPQLNDRVYPPRFMLDATRDRMKLALKVYRAYRKLYPDLVMDETFDAWAMKGRRADKYIKDYDLGPEHPPKERWPKRPVAFELSAQGGYVEFDASKIEKGYHAWHPNNPGCAGCWASKENAQRYALVTRSDEGDFWSGHAGTSVPLHVVGRIVQGKTEGQPVLEIEFDFGTRQMIGPNRKRWALRDEELAGARHFTDEAEYNRLVATCKAEYEAAEAEIRGKIAEHRAKYPSPVIPTGQFAMVYRSISDWTGEDEPPAVNTYGTIVEVDDCPEHHQCVEFTSEEGTRRVFLPRECITLYTPETH